jgi:Domain of unknown function (DUF4349)
MTDATMDRDLAAVDAALEDGAATHPDPHARELQELALALRAEASEPDPAFATRLRARAERGFPRESDAVRRARRPARPWRGLLAPLAGTALVAALIGAIALAPHDGSDDGASGGSTFDSGASAGGGASELAPAQPLGADRGFAPNQPERRIERSFSLELDVPADDMNRVADQVTAVTNRHGGFVLSSSLDTGSDGGDGDFSLRIPSDEVRPALRDLAGLAPVIHQTQEGRDVTREHVTARDRLQAARAERRSLLRRLAAAQTDAEAEAIRRRLDLVSGEINGLRAQLRNLRLRTDYAVVGVHLSAGEGGSGAASGSLDDAVDDAGGLLIGLAGVLIRVLAVGIPLALIALLAWLAARGVRRRRRESALA